MTLGYLYPSVHHPHLHHHPPRPHLPRRNLRRLLNLSRTRPLDPHLGLTRGLSSRRFRRRLMLLRRPNMHVHKERDQVRVGVKYSGSGGDTGINGSACSSSRHWDQL